MADLLLMLGKYNRLLIRGLNETIYMVGYALLIAVIVGLPLGFLTAVTRRGQIMTNNFINRGLNFIINIGRSIPFIILMVAVIPLTRILTGSSIGTTAAVVPLALAAVPFVGRVVDNALLEVRPGVVEAAQAMGATPWQIIYKVLLKEALPGIILGVTLTAVNLVGYSAMAGVIGGGGLGDIAVRYGYQRFKLGIMIETVVILIILVQLIQWLGNLLAGRFDHR